MEEAEKKLERLTADVRTVADVVGDVLKSDPDVFREDFSRETLKSLFDRGIWIERLFAETSGNSSLFADCLKACVQRTLGPEVCCARICDSLLAKFVRSAPEGLVYDAIADHVRSCGRERTLGFLQSSVSVRTAFRKLTGSWTERLGQDQMADVEASLIVANWSRSFEKRREKIDELADRLVSDKLQLCLAVLASDNDRESRIAAILSDKLSRKLKSSFTREFGTGLLNNKEVLVSVLNRWPELARSVFGLLRSVHLELKYCDETGSWITEENGSLSYDQLVDFVDAMTRTTSNLTHRTKAFVQLAKRENCSLWSSVENDVQRIFTSQTDPKV